MSRLLLIGGGVMQLPVIHYAHKMKVEVLCFDGNPWAPARELADEFEVCDIKDQVLCAQKAAGRGLDGVITVGTDFSTTVSWVAQSLGLPCTPYEAALRAKDKGLMRSRFEEAGIASPRFRVISGPLAELPTLEFGFPVVVKPTDSMGARGVQLVRDPSGLWAALAAALTYSSTSRVIVEEYIEGPEFSLDAIVRDGKLQRCGLADRIIVFPPAFVEIGHTFPSAAPAAVQEAVWAEFERGVRALGITDGAAKGDVKFQEGRGAVIGEIANRLSGGYMSGWTYPLSSGRSAVQWAVETALGKPLSPQELDQGRAVAERAWIGMPGRLRSVRGQESVRAMSGVKELFLLVRAGQETVFPRNNVEKLGNLIVMGDSPEKAEEIARAARNALILDYEPSHPGTDAFLKGNSGAPWWFAEAEGLPEAGPAQWLAMAEKGRWTDLYGNTLEDLVSILESEGLQPREQPPLFWRCLLVGGLSGARYAAQCQ